MTKKKKKSRSKFDGKTVKSRKMQDKNLLPDKRWPERAKTGESKDFSIQEYERDIIQFAEREVYLPEKKEQLITLEKWEREVFTDCFYKNRPRLILISLAKKNGKSTFSAVVLNWFLTTQESGEIYVCSNSKDQSNFITYRKIVTMIKKNPKLNEQVRVYTDYIENIKTGSILRCLSSSYRSSAGLNCLLICIDELASFDTDSLKFFFEEMQLSPVYKNPLILVTSTAGRSEEGLLWDLIKESKKGNTAESYFYVKQGEEANPSSFVTKKYLNSQEHKPGMRPNLFKRLHKNLWVSEEESFISDEDFRVCIDFRLKRRPGIKIPIWVGLDIGVKDDYTAICGVGKTDNKIFSVDHKIYIPSKTEELQFDDVKRYLIELSKLYDIQGLYFDPYQSIQLSQDLKKENINVVEISPTPGNCVAFSQCLFNLIKNQGISFYESEEIRLSLINCKVIYSTRGWRIVKKSGTKKIDLAIALAMACYGAVTAPEGSDTEKLLDDMSENVKADMRMGRNKRLSSQYDEEMRNEADEDWGGASGSTPRGDW
jgi:phage terminase large subunit-like protein